MIDRVLQTNRRFSLFSPGDSIVVALSGGADSVALLHLLYSIKEKYDLTLCAAHLNHGIRGEEAQRDEKFCKILCKNYNLPFFVEHKDIPLLAAERGQSEELCGREERYAFLQAVASKQNAKIATAHTASDNAETLIFNLSRGASVAGASGIPPKRGNIIRPLIGQTRAQIEEYCRENELSYVTDSTNLSEDYTRNKIRSRLVPLFKELNPSFENAALRFTQSAAQTRDYLNFQAQKALDESRTEYGYDAKILLKNHNAVLYSALAILCGGCADHKKLDLIASVLPCGGAVCIGGGKTAVCRQGLLRVTDSKANQNFLEIPLNGEISFDFGDNIVCASINNSNKEFCDPIFRFRKSGDRFTYARRKLTKPLRKMMNEQKIPSELRDCTLLLCSGSVVLWCMGAGYSEQGELLREKNGLDISIVPKQRKVEDA